MKQEGTTLHQEMLPIAILAGGLATRLRPLTEKIPKALLEINGEPFIACQLKLLHSKGIRQVVICVGYLGEMIVDYVGNGSQFDLDVSYSFDDPNNCSQLLGTGGALKRALPLLGAAFLVVYGDSYLPCDYQAAQQTFFSSDKQALMTVFRNEGQWDKSNVEFAGQEILVYDKRQQTASMKYIDYGLGIFKRTAFAEVPEHTPCDLADLYGSLLQQRQLAAHVVTQRFYETGSLSGIKELESYLRKPSLR